MIGHSEGGIIAPMIASENKEIAFIVLLAGSGLPGDQLMLLQKESIERKMGIDEKAVVKSHDIFKGAYQIIVHSKPNDTSLKAKIETYFSQRFSNKFPQQGISDITNKLVNPWMVYFLKINPTTYLRKTKCPVLALNGSKDLQVLADQNISAIKQALTEGGNKDVTTEILPDLNHLFQECKTGLPNEYATIEQTFSPKALLIIKDWILKQAK